MILGEKIKSLIKSRGYSATQMADKIGITNPYMYKIFKMESVDTKYLNKIAEVLDLPVTIFFIEERLESNANPVSYSRDRAKVPPIKEYDQELYLSSYLKETIKAQSKLINQMEDNMVNLKETVRRYDLITDSHLKDLKVILSKQEYDFLLGRKVKL
jgi:transcriptional regulator with XRE-family HTH domain